MATALEETTAATEETTATTGAATQTAVSEETTETATETATQAAATETDWRSEWAAGDDKLLGWLGRYQSPKAAMAAVKKHGDDIASGKYVKPPGEDASDEEVAAYRKQMGVPDAVEGYLKDLSVADVIGEDDKPFIDTFAAAMLEVGAPKNVSDAAIATYFKIVEEQESARIDAAAAAGKLCEDSLREEWTPGEFRRNENILANYRSMLPEAVRASFEAIDGDGKPMGFNPEFRKWFLAKALEENPIATVVPGAGANQASAIADELKALEKKMENRREWFKDEAAQARYQELITAQDKLNERGG